MLRKATVSYTGTGPDGLPYDTDSSGHYISWNLLGPVTSGDNPPLLDGSCSLFGYVDQSSCQTAGGVWTTGNNSLFYMFGGWMNTIAGAGAYNAPGTSIAAPGSMSNGGSYSCARCHATGVTMVSTVSTTRQPEKTYPGINGYVNFDPDGNGPATSVFWASGVTTTLRSLDGVQCERCHNAQNHFTTGPTTPRDAAATALCLQCHRQEHTVIYTSGGIGANMHPTPATDNSPIPTSEPEYALPAIEVGGTSGYAPQFYGYSTGMEFLNSVHAKYTGNYQQINNPANYASTFLYGTCDLNGYSTFDQPGCEAAGGVWTDDVGCKFDQSNCVANSGIWTALKGTCTTCHDVHQSTVAAVNASAPFTKKCPDCHVNSAVIAPQIDVATMTHPTGAGTPFGNPLNINAGCVKCHMPKPNDGAGRASHIWRISTSATYTTFPTAAEWGAGQKTANIAAAGSYPNAVWIDAGLACGPCHSVSKDNPANRPAKHYFEKAALAAKTAGIHSGSQWSTVCEDCHMNGGDPAAWQINPGVNHHAVGCTDCHLNPGVVQSNLSLETCLSCHGPANPLNLTIQPVEQGTNHHTGNCASCHTTPGVPQFTTANASCQSCHAENMVTWNHPSTASTPAGCVVCHVEPGVPVISTLGVQTVCGSCHGGSSSTTHNGAPYRTVADLSVFAVDMHRTKPKARFNWSKSLSTNYAINFNASSSVCPAGATCSYSWSTGETGKTTSHTFADATTTPVTLSVTASPFGTTDSYTLAVTPVFVNSDPIATATSAFSLDGFEATYTDHSSGGSGNLTVKVTWGDGKVSIVVPGSAPTHVYTRARNYSARATVFDMGVNGSPRKLLTDGAVSRTLAVLPLSISGLVTTSTGTPLQGVVMTLEQVTATKTIVRKRTVTRANGVYTFSNVLPNVATGAATSTTPYTLVPAKKNFTFPAIGTFSVTNAIVSVPTITAN
jgi:hypothetical protein